MIPEKEPCDILEEIRAGMAAVTTEQLCETPPKARPREPGEPSLGEADEYLKRFFWYVVAQGKKLEPLIEEGQRLVREVAVAFDVVPGNGMMAFVPPTPQNVPKVLRIQELERALEIPIQIVNGLWLLFFAEVRRRNPLLRQCARPIICMDWTFSDADYQGEAGQESAEPSDEPESFPGIFMRSAESDTPQ